MKSRKKGFTLSVIPAKAGIQKRFYTHRVIGRNRNYRPAAVYPDAGIEYGQGASQADIVQEQS